jgi:hypothetical protein
VSTETDGRFWTGDPETRWQRAQARQRKIRSQQSVLRRTYLLHAALYRDIPTLGLGPYAYAQPDPTADELRMNMIKAVIDTYVSMVTRSTPKPMVITTGGDWSLKKRGKGMSRWWEAKADESEFYDATSQPIARDHAVWGTGWVKVFEENEQIPELADVSFERVLPWEITIDDAETQLGFRSVRTFWHQKWYDREVLCEMFPRKKSMIRDAPRHDESDDDLWSSCDTDADLVCVSEAYRLKSTPRSEDGRRLLYLPNGPLADVSYDEMTLPFVPSYRATPPLGVHGISIPHELRGLQMSINQDLIDAEDAIRLVARPKWFVPEGANVPDAHLDDDIASIIRYAGGTPPTVGTPGMVLPPEFYSFLWAKWQKGFELIGLSQQASTGEVDHGVSGSGASIRASTDIRDGRFFEAQKKRETWHMTVADRAFDIARRIAKKNPKYASTYQAKTYIEVVNFADVDMQRDQYRLRVLPISSLSSNPAQRLAQVKELYADGAIDVETYRGLLDYPDLESEQNLLNSPRALAEKLIERFLEADDPDEDDVYIAPDPNWPLEKMKVRFLYAICSAQLDGAPDENVALLDQWVSAADALLADKAAQAAAMAPPPSPMGAPPMPGGAPAPPMMGAGEMLQ